MHSSYIDVGVNCIQPIHFTEVAWEYTLTEAGSKTTCPLPALSSQMKITSRIG
jgi:hypothetical protein